MQPSIYLATSLGLFECQNSRATHRVLAADSEAMEAQCRKPAYTPPTAAFCAAWPWATPGWRSAREKACSERAPEIEIDLITRLALVCREDTAQTLPF